jgi:hypothetical protein
MSDEDLTEDSLPIREQPHTEEELVEYDLGIEAGISGRRKDETKSAAWLRGWADGQE